MPAIKQKNVLRLGEDKRRRIWNELRDESGLEYRLRVGDIAPIPFVGRWSVGARGVVEFLIGDDPGPGL